MGQFIDPEKFVNTGFINCVSYEELDEEGDVMIIRERTNFNETMNLCFLHTSERWVSESSYKPESKVSGMIYRTYCELDLLELKRIDESIEERTGVLQEIDPESILSIYEGRTMFSIYFDTILVYEQLHSQLMSQNFEQEESLNGEMIENSYLRRLLQILKLPSTDLKKSEEDD